MKNEDLSREFTERLRQLEVNGAERSLAKSITSEQWIQEGGKLLLNLSSNDYLALSGDAETIAAFPAYGAPLGSGSSRLLTGNYPLLNRFEAEIASAYHKESALLFNSGYHANSGIIAALGRIDGVRFLVDRMAHASILDGLTMGRCRFTRFRHNDMAHLSALLDQELNDTSAKAIIVVVESIYSMDGDLAPLRELAALKQRDSRILLYVDEAHAVGVRGENGYGLSEETGTVQDIDFLIGTFGKAILGMGAYISTDRLVVRYLVNIARSLIFSTMLPEAVMAWNRFIFLRLPQFKAQRAVLRQTSEQFRDALSHRGYSGLGQSHIVPVILGSNERALRVAEELKERGYHVQAIRYPTVAKGTERLRLSLTAGMSFEQLEPLIEYLSL